MINEIVTALSIFILSILLNTPILSIISLLLFSHILGKAVDSLSQHLSPSKAAFLSTTAGNMAEIILSIIALKNGLVEVVKASIIGSIAANALLILGLSSIISKKEMKINENVSHFIISVMFPTLMITAIYFMPIFEERGKEVEASILASLLFLLFYIGFAFSVLKENEIKKRHKPSLSLKESIAYTLFSTIMLIFSSEIVVKFFESLSMPTMFFGFFILGILGSASENIYVIDFAKKEKFSLVIHSTVGSVAQIILVVLPLLFFSSLLFKPMTLTFTPLELFSLWSSTLLTLTIIIDKKINKLEGFSLLFFYIFLSLLFYLHP